MDNISQLKNLCVKWNEYILFDRQPEDGIKNLLFDINDLRYDILQSGIEEPYICEDDLSLLIWHYVMSWDTNVEDNIQQYINYWINYVSS